MALTNALNYIRAMSAKGAPLSEEAKDAIIYYAATQTVEHSMKHYCATHPMEQAVDERDERDEDSSSTSPRSVSASPTPVSTSADSAAARGLLLLSTRKPAQAAGSTPSSPSTGSKGSTSGAIRRVRTAVGKAGPGKLNDLFTAHVGSDRYGYIVTEVLKNGNTIIGEGYDGATEQRTGGGITLTWHGRINKGQGAWVREGEKHRRKGGGFSFGRAENYLDPSF